MKKKHTVVLYSGSGTKIPAHFAVAERINKEEIKPNIIAGNSGGAIIALLQCLDLINSEIKERLLNLEKEDFFSFSPLNKKNKFNFKVLFRLLMPGTTSLGKMDNLKKLLKEYITENRWKQFSLYSVSPKLYVIAVNETTGELKTILLNNLSFDGALDWVVASASIPIFTQPVKIGSHYYCDGGLMEYIPNTSENLLNEKVTDLICSYASPKDSVVIDHNTEHTEYNKRMSNKFIPGGIKVGYRFIKRVLPILEENIAIQDITRIREFVKANGINYIEIVAPIVLEGIYDTDKHRLSELYSKTRILAIEKIKFKK